MMRSFRTSSTTTILLAACSAGVAPTVPGRGSMVDDGSDETWCCDPDEPSCECPSLWHCTEGDGRKRCEQEHPFLPDAGGRDAWECAYEGSDVVCRGAAWEHPDAGGEHGWSCATDAAGEITCRRPAEGDDFPDEGGASSWSCSYGSGGEMRACESGEGGAACGGEQCGNGVDDDCDGLGDCLDPDCGCGFDGEECNGEDDDRDGRIDEGRVCGDANEGDGACPVGAIRICDAYCGVHQTCGPDGRWGPCRIDEDCLPLPICSEHGDCPRGMFCDIGYCVESTSDGPCDSDDDCGPGEFAGDLPQICERVHGVCVVDCFHHSDCGPGNVCDMGICQRDEYVPGPC